jgi:hypothetical protein
VAGSSSRQAAEGQEKAAVQSAGISEV